MLEIVLVASVTIYKRLQDSQREKPNNYKIVKGKNPTTTLT